MQTGHPLPLLGAAFPALRASLWDAFLSLDVGLFPRRSALRAYSSLPLQGWGLQWNWLGQGFSPRAQLGKKAVAAGRTLLHGNSHSPDGLSLIQCRKSKGYACGSHLAWGFSSGDPQQASCSSEPIWHPGLNSQVPQASLLKLTEPTLT